MTIEADIITWALTRPAWQQEVLVSLASGHSYTEDQLEALVDDILAGHKTAPSQEAKSIAPKPDAAEQVSLRALTEVVGVNALISGQTLEFGSTGLTIVYGDNASGKSGYARLIMKDEVGRLKKLEALKAARSAADTNSVTQKSSALTRQYATKMILDEFTRETERLQLRRVTLDDLGGRKGQLTQRPGLLGATRGTTTRTVLSEGEQTALGLAGFFTEAVFDKSKSAVIFDDPVTSLDHVRRDKVAQRLAQLAEDRQVVVFTHDVAFVGNLTASAESEGVAVRECSIERRGSDPGMCVQWLPWKAKDFGSRVDHLRTELAKLTKERPNLLQDEYEERVATWAGYLSETWERCVTTEVLNQVFDRGTSHVLMQKFRVLARVTDEDDQDLQEGYGATSKWGRRHDKSVETNYVAPEPGDLEGEFNRLVEWQKRVKKYR
ncbi:hypothetical protein CIW52_29945 [Mycolicibacterium sp. P9-64]|uniref:hypothetical protein n=1 Tax=Mycolicibacterium sp. P9-64 TaxID=2024612 RepID=UPI0011EC91F4|nr:hypothetical protein [Mycolicibacterium sp. P9-64]KAA0078800.1 hypothetical protein CIW52_29945 [Mycolicibacterium sp. P9-64]